MLNQGERGARVKGLAVEQPREGDELRRRARGGGVDRVARRERVGCVEQRLPRDALHLVRVRVRVRVRARFRVRVRVRVRVSLRRRIMTPNPNP